MTWPAVMQQAFFVRAALALLVMAPALALVGMLVVSRRQSFFATIVSQSALCGVGIGIWLGEPATAPTGGIVAATMGMALLLVWLRRHSAIAVDTLSGVALAATSGLGACAMAIVARHTSTHRVAGLLLGDVLLLRDAHVWGIAVVTTLVCGLWWWLQRTWRVQVLQPAWLQPHVDAWADYGFGAAVAVLVVAALPVVGGLLVEGMMVLPAVAALSMATSWRAMTLLAVCVAWCGGAAGLLTSATTNFPVGGACVVWLAIITLAALLWRAARR
jgi:zinc transport system permease protein